MEFSENKPIYLQIADEVIDRIARGELGPGARLPSVREYAAKVGVNANTVMRSYAWLEQEGLIYNKRGIGFFISADSADRVSAQRRSDFIDRDLSKFMEKLKEYAVTPSRMAAVYDAFLKGDDWKSML